MATICNMRTISRLSILRFTVLSFVVLLFPSQLAARICLSNITITNPAPILIPCGGATIISGSVNYAIDNMNLNWGNCWTVAAPRNFTAQLYDDDGVWGNELYGETSIAVPAAPATGTINFSISLPCTFDADCDDCLVNGDEHEAELFIAFWKELVGVGSPVKLARCTCSSCARRLSADDFQGTRGSSTTTELSVENTFSDVQNFEVTMFFDQNSYNASEITFFDPIVQANTVVDIESGSIHYSAFFDPPVALPSGPFASLQFSVSNSAPLSETEIVFDDSSAFIDSDMAAIPSCLPAGVARSLPVDIEPPVIDDSRIQYGPCSLQGGPGSISDDFLGAIPGYVTLEAFTLDSNLLGFVSTRVDGSFLFPNTSAPPGAVELRATDEAGNSVSAVIQARANCVPDIPALSTTGILILLLLVLSCAILVLNRRARPETKSLEK